jgi:antitoxin component YwqK of YwqJK toxin-antitoxin module
VIYNDRYQVSAWDEKGNKVVKNGNGIVTYYDEKGRLHQKMTYKDSLQDGHEEYYDSTGKLTEYYIFYKGYDRAHYYLDEKGKWKADYEYSEADSADYIEKSL